MHSGTTLVHNIIGGHAEIYSPKGETRFFHSFSQIKQNFSELSNDDIRKKYIIFLAKLLRSSYGAALYRDSQSLADFYLDEEVIQTLIKLTEGHTNHTQFFKTIFQYFTVEAGARRWMEKTPNHLFHIETILALFPEALFIELVRDPRDILNSKRSRLLEKHLMSQRSELSRKLHPFQVGYDPLWDSIAWKSAIRCGRETAVNFPGKILRVRYEDLVSQPEQAAQSIFKFLDLPYSSALLNVPWVNTADSSKWRQKGIKSSAVGKWKKNLSQKETYICQTICRREMSYLGYEPTKLPVTAALYIPRILVSSSIEFFQRIYRRYQLGGLSLLRPIFDNYRLLLKNLMTGQEPD